MDLTKGSLRKKMVLFSVPLVMTSVLNRSFTFADSVIVSRFCGASAMSAVALAGTLYSLFVAMINGFSAGCSIVIAKAFGRGDRSRLKSAVGSLLMLGGAMSALLAVFCALASETYLVHSGAPAEIVGLSDSVLMVYAAGIPFYGISIIASGILNGMGDTKNTFRVSAISGVTNVLLDLAAVSLLNTGVMGCAAASVAAQMYSMAHLLVLLRRQLKNVRCAAGFEGSTVSETLRIASTIIAQEMLFNLLAAYVQGVVNPHGIAYINGYSVGRQICSIFSTAVNGYTRGYSAAISQNYGAGNADRVRQARLISRSDGNRLCLMLAVLSILAARPLCGFMLPGGSEEALRFGSAWILFSIPNYFAALHTQRLNYELRLIGQNRIVLLGSILSMAARFVCIAPAAAISVGLLPLTELTGKVIAAGYLRRKRASFRPVMHKKDKVKKYFKED